MAVASAEREATARPVVVAERWERTWRLGALGAILVLAAVLNVWGIDQEGYGNTYYAAAVKSMLTSWHAFFFASFDAGGFVTVDKPPVGLWVQAASAKLFGYSGLSLLLPQAIAGVLSVAVLYRVVSRVFGTGAGLLAALALALMPISVVVNHNNTMDSQLVLVALLAVWAGSRAAESGGLRLLLLCAALVGLGFNIKMMQAYLVLPALWLAYAVAAPLSWRRRAGHLTLATAVLLAVSLAWVAIVDLTPADARPYVGSSGTNSALSLVLGYNGLGRLTQAIAGHVPLLHVLNADIDLQLAPGFSPGIGEAGPLRLLNDGIAGQASWLLPLAVIGLLVAAWQLLRGDGGGAHSQGRSIQRRRLVGVLIWGGWLLTCGAYFSVARFFHLYYLVMLAPAVAALAGIGGVALWREYQRGGWGTGLLPAALVATAAVQLHMLSAYPDWRSLLAPLILAASAGGALALLALRLGARLPANALAVAAAVPVLGLLAAPAAWSVVSVRDGSGGAWLPQAGPAGAGSFGGPGFAGPGQGGQRSQAGNPGGQRSLPGGGTPPQSAAGATRPGAGQGAPFSGVPSLQGAFAMRGGGAMTFAGEQWNNLDPGLVAYLAANQGDARYLVATPTSSYASLFILATGRPAMALGGYQGWDRILTPEQLAALVAGGSVRFFYLNSGGFGGRTDGATAGPNGAAGGASSALDGTTDLTAWVRATCTIVTAETWHSGGAGASTASAGRGGAGQAQQLYDCAPRGTPAT